MTIFSPNHRFFKSQEVLCWQFWNLDSLTHEKSRPSTTRSTPPTLVEGNGSPDDLANCSFVLIPSNRTYVSLLYVQRWLSWDQPIHVQFQKRKSQHARSNILKAYVFVQSESKYCCYQSDRKEHRFLPQSSVPTLWLHVFIGNTYELSHSFPVSVRELLANVHPQKQSQGALRHPQGHSPTQMLILHSKLHTATAPVAPQIGAPYMSILLLRCSGH